MDITLVITTYNRAAVLSRALQSAAQLRMPPDMQAELLIVDNNSRDHTRALAETFCAQPQPVATRYVFEPQQGLSHARNRALAEARGAIIAFMDDDQQIDANYITQLAAAFAESNAQCIGGKVLYSNAVDLPAWLRPLIKNVGQIDLGDKPLDVNARNVFLKGGNIAFRTEVLRQLGGFDTNLGRRGSDLLAAEEDALQVKIVETGGRVRYDPRLVQYNWLLPEKLTKRYWRKHAYGYGRTLALLPGSATASVTQIAGIPLWCYRQLITAAIGWCVSLLKAEPIRFRAELDVWQLLGVATEHRRRAR